MITQYVNKMTSLVARSIWMLNSVATCIAVTLILILSHMTVPNLIAATTCKINDEPSKQFSNEKN
jgi:hypothetical protein